MAKNEYKVMSHVERMKRTSELDDCKPKGLFVDLCSLESKVDYFIDESGRAQRKVSINKVKLSDNFKDLKVNDFSIDNLSAIGAVGSLKFSQISGDVDVSTYNIERLMDKIDSEIIENNNKNISSEE